MGDTMVLQINLFLGLLYGHGFITERGLWDFKEKTATVCLYEGKQ